LFSRKPDVPDIEGLREELREEELRIRRVRWIVDLTAGVIMQSRMHRTEAEQLVRGVRTMILRLFPGGDETYEIVYARRFRRLLDEFTLPD
jgi:hypothetical protein